MQHYLRSTRDVLRTLDCNKTELDVVLGNESCDLDSAVSALVYGYYLQFNRGRTTPTSCHNISYEFEPCYNLCQNNVTVIPVLNISRADFPLRTEVTFLLNEYELLQNSLTFRDEIDLERLCYDKRLKLHLVDHNRLFNDPQFEDVVVDIVDHHKDERPPTAAGTTARCLCNCRIEMVGSCCTLVAETIFRESPDFLTSDAAIVPLLLGTILLDTVNLSEQAGRATPKDAEMVRRLHALRPHLDLNVIFGNLQNAKFDVSMLATVDLLRKDMKSVHGVSSSPSLGHFSVAVSSIAMHLEKFLRRVNVEQDMEDFAKKYEYSLIVLMGINTNIKGDVERQLGVYSTNTGQLDMITSCLHSISLDLHPLKLPGVKLSNMVVFVQSNVKASRKQVLPALTEFLKSL